MVLIVLPLAAGHTRAADDLVEVPDFKVSSDGILSWGEVDGWYRALVEIGTQTNKTDVKKYVYKPDQKCDVKDMFASEGYATGTYWVGVTLYNSRNVKLTYSHSTNYTYTCTGSKPTTVPKLVWNESQKKITWKPSSSNADERYFVTVDRKVSDPYSFCVDTPELPFYYFLSDGQNDVTISVCIRKYGCPDGDPGILSKTYTYKSDPIKFNLDDKGIIHVEWVTGADEMDVMWHVKGSTSSSGHVFSNQSEFSFDIEESVANNHCAGQEIIVEVQAYKRFTGWMRVIAKADTSYVSTTEVYSLTYMGNELNSRNIKNYEQFFQYDPATKTLKFNDYIATDLPYFFFLDNLFYSTDDLIITGTATLRCNSKALESEKTLTFAKDSDIVVLTTDAGSAVIANKVVINGKNLMVNAQTGNAIQGKTSVSFGSAFREGRFISGSDAYAVGVSSSSGKISLGSAKIVLPSGGKLGADSRYIYESDGKKPSKNVSVKSSSYALPSGAIPIDAAHFPSEFFRTVIDEKMIDRNMDMYLEKSECVLVKNLSLYAESGSQQKLTSSQGVEYFTELEHLSIGGALITSVDLSNNPKLSSLTITDSTLENIDISNNPILVDTYKFGEKTNAHSRNTYVYREDPNDINSKQLGYLCLDENMTVDIVGPTAPTDMTVEIGKSFQYLVSGISPKNFTWSVGNTAVATVDANGNVTGKSFGNTYLYAKLLSGKTYKCLVRVVYPPLSVRYSEKTLHINQTFQFAATGASGQKVTWSVGNTAVASVDANGKVTAKKAANTYLYAKTADGRVAKCLLKVVDPGTLGINYTEKTVYLGQNFTFTAKNVGILSVTWSVGNTSIAKVDSASGKVTPVSVGNTYLYAKTADGRSARCLIKVVDPGPLSIRYSEKTIKVGASFQFTATNPAGQKVTWRVGNTAVATVDANGKVTGKKAANTWLYATTPDGRETKCLIKVVA